MKHWEIKFNEIWKSAEMMIVNYRWIYDSNVAKVCVLSRWVFHLHNRFTNALKVTERIFKDAVVFGTRTVRCHRNYRHHVAVIIVDDNIVIIRMTRWCGYCDCVVVVGSIEVVIVGTTSGRSISITKLAAWHQTFVFDVDSGYEIVFDIWCWRGCTEFSSRCNRRCCSWCWVKICC